MRRVVLGDGDGAGDDHDLTDELTGLRNAANWSFLLPRLRARRARFLDRLREYLERAEPGSLAELIARGPVDPEVDPVEQVPQWLFAFDPAGAAALRALALPVAHPAELRAAPEEIGDRDLDLPQDLSRLRPPSSSRCGCGPPPRCCGARRPGACSGTAAGSTRGPR